MKLTLVFLFSMMSLSAFAYCDGEAEFIGRARNVVVKSSSVTYQIKLGRFFVVNPNCPLQRQEAEQAVIEVQGYAGIAEGDEVSGVLVYDAATNTYKVNK